MENRVDFQKEFSNQSESYVKFLIYHTVIIFTIVFALLSGVNNIESAEVNEKVYRAKELEKISERPSGYLIKDDLLSQMYFTHEDEENAINRTPADTSEELKIIYTPEQKDTASKEQLKLLNDIENIYSKAFIVKLSFLGDIQVDLRTWIFLLPFFLLFSIIYIFILDYKVSLIKTQALISNSPISLSLQYPYNFLRPVFIVGEIVLFAIYIYVLTIFLKYSDQFFKGLIFHAYILMLYYGLIYCLYIVERLNRSNEIYVRRIINVFIKKTMKKITWVISKINPFVYLRTGQILILLTLFLIMTYDTCNEGEKVDPKFAVRGYELIITLKNWETEYGDGFAGFFYKYLYCLTIVFTLLLIFVYRKKSKLQNRKLLQAGHIFFTNATLFYSIYFCFYDIWLDEVGIVLSFAFLIYWYYFFYLKIRNNWNSTINQFGGYVLFLVPHFVFSIINIISNHRYRNGWIFFYLALCLIITAMAFITNRKEEPS